MQQFPDRRAKYERALAVVVRIHQVAGLQNIPLPLVSRGMISKRALGIAADLSVSEDNHLSSASFDQLMNEATTPSKLVSLPSPSSASKVDWLATVPTPSSPTMMPQMAAFCVPQDQASPLMDTPLSIVKPGDAVPSRLLKHIVSPEGSDPISKKSSTLGRVTEQEDPQVLRHLQKNITDTSKATSLSRFHGFNTENALAELSDHSLNAAIITPRSEAARTLKSVSTPSSTPTALPMTGPMKTDTISSYPSIDQGVSPVVPLPFSRDVSVASDRPEATSRSAQSNQAVIQGARREQVISRHPAGPSSMTAALSPGDHVITREPATTPQVINLTGSFVMDGRRLGYITASAQAREISLPARGPSRVNLRTVPIYSGVQIPS